MRSTIAVAFAAALPGAMACLGHDDGLPQHTGEEVLSEPRYIAAGEVFDAGWVKYDRGVPCGGQGEGGMTDFFYTSDCFNKSVLESLT
jgi:pectate lyase